MLISLLPADLVLRASKLHREKKFFVMEFWLIEKRGEAKATNFARTIIIVKHEWNAWRNVMDAPCHIFNTRKQRCHMAKKRFWVVFCFYDVYTTSRRDSIAPFITFYGSHACEIYQQQVCNIKRYEILKLFPLAPLYDDESLRKWISRKHLTHRFRTHHVKQRD